MKTFIIISIVFCNICNAQEIIYRQDNKGIISIMSSSVPVQLEPNFCSAGAGSLIPKDTSIFPIFMLSFFYNAPLQNISDSTDAIEFVFADGKKFNFQKYQDDQKLTLKDSSVFFGALIDYECLKKMRIIPVNEIIFITKEYRHTVLIEDKNKLFLPTLSRFIVDKTKEEYNSLVK